MTTKPLIDKPRLAELNETTLLDLLYYMKLMRAVEQRIERVLYRQGKIPGAVYSARGEEAIPVGSAAHLRPDDVVVSLHRTMGMFFIRGVPLRRIIAQYMGRKGGVTDGRDGNMHMGDLAYNIIAPISHLAETVPVAAGAALAIKMRGEDRVVYCYFGDGATSTGSWHEGVNFAAVQRLPLVLICDNNQWAYSTPLEKQMAVEHIVDRAAGYGIATEIVNGNDVLAVHEATGRAVARARAGEGPTLLECKTFRMTGHAAHDDARYVPAHLFEEWRAKDPIDRYQRYLREQGFLDEEKLNAMEARIEAEIDEAIAWAERQPYPSPDELERGVYYES